MVRENGSRHFKRRQEFKNIPLKVWYCMYGAI